jgi:hypothetical protein
MRVTDNIQVFPSELGGTDIAGNVNNQGFPDKIVLQSNNQDSDYGTTILPKPEPIQDNGNVGVPLLITPVIDNPNVPVGSGSSIVVEPEIIEPIVKDVPATNNPNSGTNSGGTNGGGTNGGGTNGGGTNGGATNGGATNGGGSSNTTQTSSDKTIVKKPKYILYIGILLALVIAYKVLTNKEK